MTQILMQARSSTSGALVTWLTDEPDWSGDFFPGPGDPLHVAVAFAPSSAEAPSEPTDPEPLLDASLIFELPLSMGEQTTTETVDKRIGGRTIDLSPFPAQITTASGVLDREVTLVAVLDSSDEDATAELDIYDQTHGIVVAGTTLSNTAAADKLLPEEFVSAALTVGSAAGNLRSDAPALYMARLRRVGGVATDAVTCVHARLHVRYT